MMRSIKRIGNNDYHFLMCCEGVVLLDYQGKLFCPDCEMHTKIDELIKFAYGNCVLIRSGHYVKIKDL